jgi:hypothetical protein
MATRAIWRHRGHGTCFLVELFAGGELVGATEPTPPRAGPLPAEAAHALLLGPLVLNPKALQLLRGKRPDFIEDFELDEEGRIWDFCELASPSAPAVPSPRASAWSGARAGPTAPTWSGSRRRSASRSRT